tara:strand:+ start:108 stop:290 length:183 start_codon:yes stop_codon:yes gene_type:complete
MTKNKTIRLGHNFNQLVDKSRYASAEEKREQWLKDNTKAIEAYNENVESNGTFSDSVRKF